MTLWIIYLLIGTVSGLLAGLLGVGGGVIIVPLLAETFAAHGVPDHHVQHLALGTSLATIAFTALSSARAHHGHGAVHWITVRRITAGIVAGTLAGSAVAARLPTDLLQWFFAAFLLYVTAQLLLDLRPKPSRELPGVAGMLGVGAGIGLISSLIGIGGGILCVPYLTWCNLPLRRAIGTSAAIGFPIAVTGAVGYIVTGWQAPGLPAQALGFVSLPALAGIAAASMLTAPLGARLSHRIPTRPLKRGFACFLLVIALRMVARHL